MKQNKFSIKKRLESFSYAWNGILLLIKEEHNARIHLFAAFLAISLGFYFSLSSIEWICLLITIGLVISLEAVNSAIENIADFISPERHKQIKKIKDLSAGAVLIVAIVAFVVGLILFLPKVNLK
ncbi:MAG TPA: diacylglycerol kinase family protein [Leptospiraceae bacterium]|nr:diacylglycerol kinase family protein [Leptospiraceae bacterium]HMW06163.1 diacylglycerol kinase family protein [Leptospiraceae bacterium]HMX30709.1 diacylglycerol kinase family protein [Leptospiraceae bacterium]HMY31824.1 diacylglycerol kinase family protein [Leptospiraceae bacterium]HMZ64940.1 diacylglycerol kinase family protein [Leptospiraceae bacterium]